MDFILAILWYLGILSTNATYTQAQLDQAVSENQTAYNLVVNDEQMSTTAYQNYDDANDFFINTETQAIDTWRDIIIE